tara:strand:+ start:341 stop:736 length:396 start_codon:yes stop_codon:yes gene_type:complete
MDKEKLEYGYRRALCLFDGGDVDLTTFAGIAIARTALLNAARVRRLKTADVSLCREILKDASLDLSVVTRKALARSSARNKAAPKDNPLGGKREDQAETPLQVGVSPAGPFAAHDESPLKKVLNQAVQDFR